MKKVTFIALLWLSAVGFAYAQNNDDWILMLRNGEKLQPKQEKKVRGVTLIFEDGELLCFLQKDGKRKKAWTISFWQNKLMGNPTIPLHFRGGYFLISTYPFATSYFGFLEDSEVQLVERPSASIDTDRRSLYINQKTSEIKLMN